MFIKYLSIICSSLTFCYVTVCDFEESFWPIDHFFTFKKRRTLKTCIKYKLKHIPHKWGKCLYFYVSSCWRRSFHPSWHCSVLRDEFSPPWKINFRFIGCLQRYKYQNYIHQIFRINLNIYQPYFLIILQRSSERYRICTNNCSVFRSKHRSSKRQY